MDGVWRISGETWLFACRNMTAQVRKSLQPQLTKAGFLHCIIMVDDAAIMPA